MKLHTTLAVALFAAGCAGAYQAPTPPSNSVQNGFPTTASPGKLMAAARRVLAQDGYQIAAADDVAGTLTTSLREQALSTGQADCGSTGGIDYLASPGTRTAVLFNIGVVTGRLDVRATIQGDSKAGSAPDVKLICYSRGPLEATMAQQIIAAASQP